MSTRPTPRAARPRHAGSAPAPRRRASRSARASPAAWSARRASRRRGRRARQRRTWSRAASRGYGDVEDRGCVPGVVRRRRPASRRSAGRANRWKVMMRRDRVAGQAEHELAAAGDAEPRRLAGLERDPPEALLDAELPRAPASRGRAGRPRRRRRRSPRRRRRARAPSAATVCVARRRARSPARRRARPRALRLRGERVGVRVADLPGLERRARLDELVAGGEHGHPRRGAAQDARVRPRAASAPSSAGPRSSPADEHGSPGADVLAGAADVWRRRPRAGRTHAAVGSSRALRRRRPPRRPRARRRRSRSASPGPVRAASRAGAPARDSPTTGSSPPLVSPDHVAVERARSRTAAGPPARRRPRPAPARARRRARTRSAGSAATAAEHERRAPPRCRSASPPSAAILPANATAGGPRANSERFRAAGSRASPMPPVAPLVSPTDRVDHDRTTPARAPHVDPGPLPTPLAALDESRAERREGMARPRGRALPRSTRSSGLPVATIAAELPALVARSRRAASAAGGRAAAERARAGSTGWPSCAAPRRGQPLVRDLGVLQTAMLAVARAPVRQARRQRDDRSRPPGSPTLFGDAPGRRRRARVAAAGGDARGCADRRRPAHRACTPRLPARQHLRHLVSMQRRYGQPFSLLLVDIDGLKRINDAYGERGRRQDARRRGRRSRARGPRASTPPSGWRRTSSACCCRTRPQSRAQVAAERLVAAIEAIEDPAGHPLRITIGVVACPQHGSAADELLELADGALYRAKAAGRGSRWGRRRWR